MCLEIVQFDEKNIIVRNYILQSNWLNIQD